ncbi:MAG: cation:proton antiporter [Candidatus Diapherotrites archaeon]
MLSGLLFDLGVIIVAGTVFGYIAKMLKQPFLLGYLVAGLVMGPMLFGILKPSPELSTLAELGVAFLLFAVGIELDFGKLSALKKPIFLVGLGQVVITALVGIAAMNALGLSMIESAYWGLILAFSSTIVVVKILSEQQKLSSVEGKLIIGIALVQDLLAVIALPVLQNVSNIFNPSIYAWFLVGLLAMFGLAWFLSKTIWPKLLAWSAKQPEIFYLTIISNCFLFIGLASVLNFSLAVGAFIGGLAISRLPYSFEALQDIRGLRDFFATIFFVSLGTQIVLVGAFPWALVAVGLLFVFFINPLILGALATYAGFGTRIGMFVGLSLAQASEFSFILASQALALGAMTSSNYSAALIVISLSLVATPYMMRYSDSLHAFLSNLFRSPTSKNKFLHRQLEKLSKIPNVKVKNHFVLVGAGLFGKQVLNALRGEGEIVVVIDHDPDVLSHCMREKIPCLYSSTAVQEVLEKASIGEAYSLIVTIPDTFLAEKFVSYAKQKNPSLVAFAKTKYTPQARQLYGAGADVVILPEIIASNVFLKQLAQFSVKKSKTHVQSMRSMYLDYLNKTEKNNGLL